jgi:hypothetical protein
MAELKGWRIHQHDRNYAQLPDLSAEGRGARPVSGVNDLVRNMGTGSALGLLRDKDPGPD